jgi:hypothetical protein
MRATPIPLTLVSLLVTGLLAQSAQSAPTQLVPWHPCARIAMACTRAGFVANGAKMGAGIVVLKFNAEGGQFALPLCLAPRNGVAWSYHQRAMDTICRDCIRRREFPARKYRLHNLVAESHPFDAIEHHRAVAAPAAWRCSQQCAAPHLC